MNNKITLIFDFDGTIADTYKVLIDNISVIEKVVSSKYYDRTKLEYYKSLYLRDLLKELRISNIKLFTLVVKLRKLMAARLKDVRIIPGITELFEALNSYNVQIILLTSNSANIVSKFIIENNIDKAFAKIICDVGLFSKDKKIRDVSKKLNLDISKTYYVGDEIRDIKSAKQAGIKMIAVTWGFNNREGLSKEHPDFIVDKPEEILKVLEHQLIRV